MDTESPKGYLSNYSNYFNVFSWPKKKKFVYIFERKYPISIVADRYSDNLNLIVC